MADEIDEFLRRAAARRKQALEQAAPPATQAARRPRPEYTRRDQEREALDVHSMEDEEEIVVEAKLIEPRVPERQQPERQQPERQQPEQPQPAPRKADTSWNTASRVKHSVKMPRLIETLTQPQGLAQAFLLREILDRPEHRW